MLWVWLVSGAFLCCLAVAVRERRSRRNLTAYDAPDGTLFRLNEAAAQPLVQLFDGLRKASAQLDKVAPTKRLRIARTVVDRYFSDVSITAERVPVDAGGVPAEWVIAPGADPQRRLLYIHGGAFVCGSAQSHRPLTSRLSEVTQCVVLAIDYRLMPEHSRMASIHDCRTAYEWLLQHAPDNKTGSARALFVGGDSAGGNLALSLLAWLRDTQRRQPDAAVAFSPVTDMAFSSPSFQLNRDTDIMLRSLFKQIKRLPGPLYQGITFFSTRMRSNDPRLSPLRGNLANLPPTLIQVSDTEMLLDDARRYVNRARHEGSIAQLQQWEGMPHVWQIFHPVLPSATAALDEVARFFSAQSRHQAASETSTTPP